METFKAALGLIRSVKDALPKSTDTEALEKALAEAEKASKIGEAQIAVLLGYELCKRHFPPGVMVEEGYHPNGKTKWRCLQCGEEPPVFPDLRSPQQGNWMV